MTTNYCLLLQVNLQFQCDITFLHKLFVIKKWIVLFSLFSSFKMKLSRINPLRRNCDVRFRVRLTRTRLTAFSANTLFFFLSFRSFYLFSALPFVSSRWTVIPERTLYFRLGQSMNSNEKNLHKWIFIDCKSAVPSTHKRFRFSLLENLMQQFIERK